ncbi:endonuclease domain-containing protein [Sphingomonas sp. Tas61C01]|uniref:endonuclease domain-containing protein n=1 Tax=Sphingomonas sp. Tas61C01 TaxID=3458297 RepID=UPI00403EC34B
MQLYDDRPSGTVHRARQLRRDAPEPERRLLRALREAFPLLKWRHQVPIGPYFADLLCFSERLVIEVDGDTHATTATADAVRTRFLRQQGYCVIRVANTDVMQNVDGVIATISPSLGEREGARRVSSGKGEGDRSSRNAAP